MRLTASARLGVVASIALFPATILFNLPAMAAAVDAAGNDAAVACIKARMRGSDGAILDPLTMASVIAAPCEDAKNDARDRATKALMVEAAIAGGGAVATLWLVGFVLLRSGRWIAAGTKPAKK